MRLFRITVLVLFLAVTGVFVALQFYNRAHTDTSYPQITFATNLLEVPVDVNETDLLADVRAQDAKDGDLTDRVIVEKISNFVQQGLSNVTYAVVDNDNHTVKASRQVRYTNYKPPRFAFTRPMRFNVGTNINILSVLRATDMIDGDISGRIKITASDLYSTTAGTYRIQAQVTNNRGDVSYIGFQVTVVQPKRQNLEITLSQYLAYANVGEAVNPGDYIQEVTLMGEPIQVYEIQALSDIDTSRAGYYTSVLQVVDNAGNTGETELAVLVEE